MGAMNGKPMEQKFNAKKNELPIGRSKTRSS